MARSTGEKEVEASRGDEEVWRIDLGRKELILPVGGEAGEDCRATGEASQETEALRCSLKEKRDFTR